MATIHLKNKYGFLVDVLDAVQEGQPKCVVLCRTNQEAGFRQREFVRLCQETGEAYHTDIMVRGVEVYLDESVVRFMAPASFHQWAFGRKGWGLFYDETMEEYINGKENLKDNIDWWCARV